MPALLQLLPLAFLLAALLGRRYPGERLIERVRLRRRPWPRGTPPAPRHRPPTSRGWAARQPAWDLGARGPPRAAAPR